MSGTTKSTTFGGTQSNPYGQAPRMAQGQVLAQPSQMGNTGYGAQVYHSPVMNQVAGMPAQTMGIPGSVSPTYGTVPIPNQDWERPLWNPPRSDYNSPATDAWQSHGQSQGQSQGQDPRYPSVPTGNVPVGSSSWPKGPGVTIPGLWIGGRKMPDQYIPNVSPPKPRILTPGWSPQQRAQQHYWHPGVSMSVMDNGDIYIADENGVGDWRTGGKPVDNLINFTDAPVAQPSGPGYGPPQVPNEGFPPPQASPPQEPPPQAAPPQSPSPEPDPAFFNLLQQFRGGLR